MKVVQFSDHGDTDVIQYADVPKPEPTPDEVLVDVKAGALNHLDVWTRQGLPGLDLTMPHRPGSDVAGVVEAVGSAVSRFKPGDHVALIAGVHCGECEFCRRGEHSQCDSYHIIGEHVPGVHGEYASIAAENLVSVPKSVDWKIAAAAPLVFGTAWRMLRTRGDVTAGESVLVLGASGGVGHAAVQIADLAGAEVFATGSNETKLAAAREHGADQVCNYTERDFQKWIDECTNGRGVDVVVDHVGAETYVDSLRSLTKGGRVLTCGATTGPNPEARLNRIFWEQLSVIGSTMASRSEFETVLKLVWDGPLEPTIRAELPMSETDRGHDLLEEREGVGKVVVIPDSEQ